MKQDEWAERLEQQLKDYQVMPSHDLWQDIEVRLDKTSKRPHIVAGWLLLPLWEC